MARALRMTLPGAWYHVINRGIERRVIYPGEVYYQKFEELLGQTVQQFGIRIHSYVLMANHYHLQIETPRENLSQAVRWLNLSYAVWFNRKRKRVGTLFQGRFKATIHDRKEVGANIQGYIHLNPVRVKRYGTSRSEGSIEEPTEEQIRGMLVELKSYPWSSFRAYAGLAKAPPWLSMEESLDEMPGRTVKRKQKGYCEYLAQKIGAGDFGSDWKQRLQTELVIGTEQFVNKVRQLMKGNRNEQTALRQLQKPALDWEKLTGSIARVWQEPWEAASERHGDPARDLAMWIARRYGGMSLGQIGEAAGGLAYPAVSDAIRRLDRRLKEDRSLKKKHSQVTKLLNL